MSNSQYLISELGIENWILEILLSPAYPLIININAPFSQVLHFLNEYILVPTKEWNM